jgi:hypothetical protein
MRSGTGSRRSVQQLSRAVSAARRKVVPARPTRRVSWFLRSASGAVLAAAVVALGGPTARAQVAAVPAVGVTADADVKSLAVGPGNTLYLGGSFSSMAMRTGHWVRFDASGVRDAAWPEVDGTVRAAVSDGAGGWYIGGAFAHVAGQRRAGLAHVGPGGELDPIWSPDVDMADWDPGYGGVTALCVVGDTVYVGGRFEAIDGQPRNTLAAVDAVSGRLRTWDPRLNGWMVSALAATGAKIYVAGEFTQVGSARREHLAAFDAATGALDAWNPGVAGRDWPGDQMSVRDLAVDRGTLYVAGQFDAIAGRARPGIAAFDIATGALSAWNPPEIDRSLNSVLRIAVASDTVYVSVAFAFVGERCKELDGRGVFLVAIDTTARADARWCAAISPVLALAAVGDRVYAGGGWPGYEQRILRVVSAATGVLGGWDPRPNGAVASLVAAGDGVLAGGDFSGLYHRPRNSAAAIDLETGTLLPFDPQPINEYRWAGTIDALAPQADSVFAAGDFVQIGGRHRRSLAKLDATTGRAQRWNAHVGARGSTRALAVRGQRVYVGGSFRRIGGRPRRGLAALDTRTGRATKWRADTNGRVRALAIMGHRLYVAGDFTRLAGHLRRHVAAINLRTGRVTAWRPDPDGPVRALAFAGRSVYLGGDFRRFGGRRRINLAAVTLSSGKVQPWRADANAPVNTLAVIDSTLYAGGAFNSIAGAPRAHIAALDAPTGAPTAWNPAANERVSALLAAPVGLVAGGDFTSIGTTSQAGVAVFPGLGAVP